jgi:hypothetical protein
VYVAASTRCFCDAAFASVCAASVYSVSVLWTGACQVLAGYVMGLGVWREMYLEATSAALEEGLKRQDVESVVEQFGEDGGSGRDESGTCALA